MKRRHKRLLTKTVQGGISTYVFVMLGTSIILYMFGFTNMLGTGLPGAPGYRSDSNLSSGDNASSIENPDLQKDQNTNPLEILLESILLFAKQNPLLIIGGLASVVLASVAGFVLGANMSVLYQYVVPLVFLGAFLNYFVFPINPSGTDLAQLQFAENLGVSTVLIIFFNLWFILGVIAFVRSGET